MLKTFWNNYSYAIILVVLIISSTLLLSNEENSHNQYMTITVSEGDSLWKIAQRYERSHQLSLNQFVKWVEANNHINGDYLLAGDTIVIPVQDDRNLNVEMASIARNE